MKNYISPEFEFTKIDVNDVISTSPGTSGPVVDEESDGWGMGLEI